MAVSKKKTLNLVFAFALLAALFFPQMALAVTPIGDVSNPTLTIHKFEQEPDTGAGAEGNGMPVELINGTQVPGVTYEITQTDSFDPGKNEWKPITGATPIEKITDNEGKAVFNGLPLGRYKVEEKSGPDHILLNTEPFYVDIPMTNKEGTTLNYNVHAYPKNETIRKNVEFKKIGEDVGALAGVTFDLYKANGEFAKDLEGKNITGLKTGNDGFIKVSGLAAGKYYFKETGGPAKYALNNTKIEFEVKKTGEKRENITVFWTPVEGFVDVNGTVTNYLVPEIEKDANGKEKLNIDRNTEFPYNLTLKTPGDIKEYSKFIVTDNLDDRLEYIADSWTVTGAEESDFEFTQDGQLLTWKVKNFAGLSGDEDIKITFKAKIRPDAELMPEETGIKNTATLQFDNNRGWSGETTPSNPPEVIPNNGGLTVTKVDASTGEKLSGAEFRLTDQDGNAINAKGTSIKVNKQKVDNLEDLVSGNDGKIEISGLTPGTYYLEETKAPTYKDKDGNTKSYRLLAQPIKVTVEHGGTAKVEVKNSKSDWLLPTTGGIGTILFTSGGLSLMLAAMVLYARRRKSESNAV